MLTEQQQTELIKDIFNLLMQHPEADISEMSNAMEAAEILVYNFIKNQTKWKKYFQVIHNFAKYGPNKHKTRAEVQGCFFTIIRFSVMGITMKPQFV